MKMPSSSSTKQGSRGGRKGKGKVFNVDSNNSSSSSVGYNIDLLSLIFLRLPLKSLLVFKSVSKQWLSIITDHKFVHKHSLQNPKGVFWGDDISRKKPTNSYISLDGSTNSYISFESLISSSEDRLGSIEIVQSCNGLVLCRSNYKRSLCDFNYTIFNPSTKKCKILPRFQPFSKSSEFKYAISVSLVFDPFKSPYYKVVAFWNNGSNFEYKFEIYDSETCTWRLSKFYTCTSQAESIPWTSGIFWNGSLYWCRRRAGSMLYFDIDQESVEVVPSPSEEYHQTKTYKIAEYGGHLYLFEIDRAFDCRFIIFEIDAAHSGWNLKGQVDMSINPYGRSPPAGSEFLPVNDNILFINEETGEEKESTKIVLITKESMVVSYNLKDMSFEKIYDLSARQMFHGSVRYHQYIESLACV